MPDYGQSYSQWWEAFAGGEFAGEYDPIAPGLSSTEYTDRTRDFYSQVVGPSFGEETGFGNVFADYISSFDIESMERAEEAFRMSIGDPYGGGDDPFAWEQASRYSPETAQEYIQEELYGTGEFLGGTAGAEYGTGMSKAGESYTSGLKTEREGLTYGGLTGSQSLISGTSGAVLRSGEGITQAEDILSEAYKRAKTLGTEYAEEKEGVGIDLQSNLDDALSTYLTAIDDEKERWYNNIMADVTRAKTTEMVTFGGGAATTEELSAGYDWDTGLLYEDVPGFDTERGACGIGELWVDNGDGTGQCELSEDLEMGYGEEGLIGVGCMDPSAANYDPSAITAGSCSYYEIGEIDMGYNMEYWYFPGETTFDPWEEWTWDMFGAGIPGAVVPGEEEEFDPWEDADPWDPDPGESEDEWPGDEFESNCSGNCVCKFGSVDFNGCGEGCAPICNSDGSCTCMQTEG